MFIGWQPLFFCEIILNADKQVAKRIANVRFTSWEVRTNQGGLPSSEGQPSRRKKGGLLMYVTYSDLIQIGIFIVTLIGLCYTIFGRKK